MGIIRTANKVSTGVTLALTLLQGAIALVSAVKAAKPKKAKRVAPGADAE